jgi:hypothetical protein
MAGRRASLLARQRPGLEVPRASVASGQHGRPRSRPRSRVIGVEKFEELPPPSVTKIMRSSLNGRTWDPTVGPIEGNPDEARQKRAALERRTGKLAPTCHNAPLSGAAGDGREGSPCYRSVPFAARTLLGKPFGPLVPAPFRTRGEVAIGGARSAPDGAVNRSSDVTAGVWLHPNRLKRLLRVMAAEAVRGSSCGGAERVAEARRGRRASGLG